VANRIDWKEVKEAYIKGSESLAAIALRFGISKRAVEKRAADEGWKALRESVGKPLRRHKASPHSTAVDEIEIIDSAIASLSAILSSGIEDTRGIGGIATGLCRLIELRNKLVPKTAADLADMAIALGLSPAEFIRALNDQWQKKA
jgi:hypothetical protein